MSARLRAALYGRMSTDMQNAHSAEDQWREAEAFAAREGFAVVARYKDEGISGATSARPGYQAMLAGAKAREFDVLVLEDLSRLARDLEESERALKILEHHDVRVVTYTRDYDTTAPGRKITRAVKGAMNALYIEELGDKTHRGQSQTVQRGFSAGGRAYGYRSEPIYEPGKVDRYGKPEPVAYRKVINDEEAKVVRFIFRQYANGNSPRAIAAELNERGMPSPGASWKRTAKHNGKRADGKWMSSTIHGQPEKGTGILCNPLYRGEFVWNRTRWIRNPETQKHECRPRPEREWLRQQIEELRIISDDLWNEVQARRRAAKQEAQYCRRPAGRPQRYPFSGLLFCAECGSRFVIVDATHYGCASYTNGGSAACGNRRRVKRAVIEEKLVETMRKDLVTREAVAGVMRHLRAVALEQRAGTDTTDKARLARKAKLEREVANLSDAIASGALRESPALAGRLQAAEAELATLASPEKPKAQVVDLLPKAEARYHKMMAELPKVMAKEPDAARSMLKRVFRRVTLRPTKDGGLEAMLELSPAQLLALAGNSSGAATNTRGSGGMQSAVFSASVKVA